MMPLYDVILWSSSLNLACCSFSFVFTTQNGFVTRTAAHPKKEEF